MSSVSCPDRPGAAVVHARALTLVFTLLTVSGCAARNADVMRQIETEPDAYRAQNTLILELPDGRRFPVNYLREGEVVYLGADGRWWRAFAQPAPVRLVLRGQLVTGRAIALRNQPELRRRVFRQLRPLFPTWMPQWAGGVLIRVTLDPPAGGG